jgi:putative nucleotidyltransferase with HDIG domain
MADFEDLTRTAKTFVAVVVLGGVAVLGRSIQVLFTESIDPQWFVFAGLTLLTGSFTVRVPGINASLSVSETFVFASVLLFGAHAGAVTVLLECLIILFWMKPGRSIHKILFNTAAPAISIWTSASVFFAISGITPYVDQAAFVPLRTLFLPLLAFTLLYFLLNSWLVAIALGFETGRSPIPIWWNNFTWLAVNYFSGASVAALIVTYMRDDDISTLAIIVPLLVVSYLTFRTAMGRVEDSNKHLNELNRLYLSTIETLAMAIDAKDQITHGHIRRVQAYAVGLAQQLGVADKKLIQAIEAAALLHDMGKLAVPEYILNKPGKLTAAEFEKMKLHASVGADILSAIEFPYPVVPIVRHHHENWDGSGYPQGLSGTEIPIGARILSVVDCFDALTSDRPYRPRLPDNDALKILNDRRGTMYDPLVVDTFVRVHAQIAAQIGPTTVSRSVLNGITNSSQPIHSKGSERFDEIAASSGEMRTLYELTHALSGARGIADAADILANHLRRLIPFAQSILFWYHSPTDELEVKHATGHLSSVVKGVRVQLGQRLSGWVAANRQTIVNSDPILDLGEVARTAVPRLRSCLSTSIVCDEQLLGVMSLYSDLPDAFDEDHRRIIEAVAQQVSHTLKRAAEFESIEPTDLASSTRSTTPSVRADWRVVRRP